MPRYALPLQDVRTIALRLRETDQAALEKLASAVAAAEVSEDGARGLARLVADLDGLQTDVSPWEFLTTYLLDRTDLLAALAGRDTVADRMRAVAIWQFLNFIRERGPTRAGPPHSTDARSGPPTRAPRRGARPAASPRRRAAMDAVRLMTVHGSKGLEFEAVHVPGLTVVKFPFIVPWPALPGA